MGCGCAFSTQLFFHLPVPCACVDVYLMSVTTNHCTSRKSRREATSSSPLLPRESPSSLTPETQEPLEAGRDVLQIVLSFCRFLTLTSFDFGDKRMWLLRYTRSRNRPADNKMPISKSPPNPSSLHSFLNNARR